MDEYVSGFRYLWAKYVFEFDPLQHCAKCLVGRWSSRIKPTMKLGDVVFDEAKAPFVYLCGVAPGRAWKNNLHVPMRPKRGSSFEVVAYNGLTIRVRDAELMFIPELPDLFMGFDKSYTTCRNFQWGVAYGDELDDGVPARLPAPRMTLSLS